MKLWHLKVVLNSVNEGFQSFVNIIPTYQMALTAELSRKQ